MQSSRAPVPEWKANCCIPDVLPTPTIERVPARTVHRRVDQFSALVLAGSYGWGGLDIPGLPPRPLAQVALRPLITYALDWLGAGGTRVVTICAHGSARTLNEELGQRCAGVDLDFAEDLLPRGPAGCIRDARPPGDENPLVVVEGTIVPRLDLRRLLEAHSASRAALTVVTTRSTAADDALWPEPAGIYVVQPHAVEYIAPHGFQDIKEMLIPKLHAAGELVTAYAANGACRRVTNLETYVTTNHAVVSELAAGDWRSPRPPAWMRRGSVLIDAGGDVHRDALCLGPVLVGRNSRVAAGATVVGPAVIGHDAVVDPGALVSRSVVGNACRIGADAIVHGSVLGDESTVDRGGHVYHGLRLRPAGAHRSWLGGLFSARRERARDRRWTPKSIQGSTYAANRL